MGKYWKSSQKIFQDVASGLNENRKGLQRLLEAIKENSNALVIIEYKDRLSRFGYTYLSRYIADFAGEVLVIEEKDIDEQQELVEDLIANYHIFFGQDVWQTWRTGCKKTDKYNRKRGICQ